MEAYVGIVRSNTRLTRAWNRLDILYEETEALFKRSNCLLYTSLARSTELMGGIGFGNSYINLKGGKMQYLDASVGASFPIRYSYPVSYTHLDVYKRQSGRCHPSPYNRHIGFPGFCGKPIGT